MEIFIIVAAALIGVIITAILIINRLESNRQLPEPQQSQTVVDNSMQLWVFLRPLKDGTFLFRSPKGRMESITFGRCEFLGFCKQFDFEKVQKGGKNG